MNQLCTHLDIELYKRFQKNSWMINNKMLNSLFKNLIFIKKFYNLKTLIKI